MEEQKIIWSPKIILYKFDKFEDFYNEGYFLLKRQVYGDDGTTNIEITPLTYIDVISEAHLNLHCPFTQYEIGDVLIVGGNSYEYIEEQPEPEPEPEPEVPEISINGIKFDVNKNEFWLYNTNEELEIEVEIKIDEYTREVYPEFPFNTIEKIIKLKANKSICFYKLDKGKIAILHLNDNKGYDATFEYENNPLYHFSTVPSLKDTIKNTQLSVNEKTDEEYKKLISEKSVFLKKRFGLTELETKNIELFPAFKSLVNLYCVKELLTVSFIQGDNILSSSPSFAFNNGLTLGKYKVDGKENSGSILSVDLVSQMIKQYEIDLSKSIHNHSTTIKKNTTANNDLNISYVCKLIKCVINHGCKKYKS